MVREFTELQGTMGGIYARHEGLPEAVWQAIAHHYLPIGVEADQPPRREQLGAGAVAWAAVSVADKLDSVVGMFGAGERPTGTRDPFALRRQAQGLLRVLVDLPELTGLDGRVALAALVGQAAGLYDMPSDAPADVTDAAPIASALDARGRVARTADTVPGRAPALPVREARVRHDQINAVVPSDAPLVALAPLDARRRLEALRAMRGSADFEALAAAFKRVKNIAKDVPAGAASAASSRRPATRSSRRSSSSSRRSRRAGPRSGRPRRPATTARRSRSPPASANRSIASSPTSS